MKDYTLKKRNFFTLSPHLLGLIFLTVGLFILISPFFYKSNNSTTKVLVVDGANVLLGLLVVFSYGGTSIDFTEKTYLEYYSLAGIQLGKKKKLPTIKLVKAMTVKKHVTVVSNGIHPSMSGDIYTHLILMYSTQTNPFLVFEHTNKNKCLEEAKYLAEHLKANLELKLT